MASGVAKLYLHQLERSTETGKHTQCPEYRVMRTVGTVDYLIGQVLSYATVKELCEHTGIWEVHISA